MKVFTITYTKTLVFEEEIEAASLEEAEQYAESRAYDSTEIDEAFDEVASLEFLVEEQETD